MGLDSTRTCLNVFSVLCLLIGIGLILSSIFSAGWMIAWNKMYGEVVEHGLIRNCEKFLRPMAVRPAGEFLCFWKFDRMIPQTLDDPYYPRQQQEHYLYGWQETVVILLSMSCVTAFVACILICVSHAFTKLHFSILTAVFAFLSTLLTVTAIILFARWSYESDYRFYIFITINVEQLYGYSFYICLAGCILFIFATLASAFCALMALKNKNNDEKQGQEVWRPQGIRRNEYPYISGTPEKRNETLNPRLSPTPPPHPQLTVTTVNYASKSEEYPSYVKVNGFVNRITPV